MPEPQPELDDEPMSLPAEGTAYGTALTFADADPHDAEEAEGSRKRLGKGFWVSIGFLALLSLLAILAPTPVLPLDNPNEIPEGRALAQEQNLPPLTQRLDGSLTVLGTDSLGRDQLSRVLHGARVSLAVGFGSVAAGALLGGMIGLAAGYYRRWIDTTSVAVLDMLLAFPPLLLAIVIISMRGRGALSVAIALTVVAIPTIARLVRANTLQLAQREFVLAARTLGASNLRVITKELLPNVTLALLPFVPLGIAVAITAEGALAFLGLSVELPTASWGGMIAAGRDELEDNWFVPMIPCAFLVATLVALNYIGDRLREFLSVKETAL